MGIVQTERYMAGLDFENVCNKPLCGDFAWGVGSAKPEKS
jgi:hypothetical protein